MPVVDQNGSIKSDNVKATYNGSKWTLAGTHKYSPKYQYFAYYPYSTSGLGHVTGTVASGTTAATFFASGISSFSVKTNQSTAANINASDLQVGKATISRTTAGDLAFAMSHAMGLASITIGSKSVSTSYPIITTTSYTVKTVYIGTDYTFDAKTQSTGTTTSTVTASTTFSGNTPYKKSSTLYGFVMKPATSTSFAGTGTDSWSLSTQAAAGAVAKSTVQSSRTSATSSNTQYKTVTGQTYSPAVGDTFYADGSLSHSGIHNYGTTPIGLVVRVDASNTKNDVSDQLCEVNSGSGFSEYGGHGLVMCLRNYGVTGSSISTSNKGTKLAYCTNTEKYESVADGIVINAKADLGYKVYNSTDNSNIDWTYETVGSGYYYTHKTRNQTAICPATRLVSEYTTLAAPSKTTGWFLPSSRQWYAVAYNYQTATACNSALATAANGTGYTAFVNGDYYASSTPSTYNDSYQGNKIFCYGGTGTLKVMFGTSLSSNERYIRPFLAF